MDKFGNILIISCIYVYLVVHAAPSNFDLVPTLTSTVLRAFYLNLHVL